MNSIIAIAIGGSIGALLRHFLSTQMYHWFGRDFPIGTLTVNIIGSFLMGFLGLILLGKLHVSMEVKMFLLVGVLGAFTTFSSFSLDAMYLIQKGQHIKALIYVGSSVLSCIIACWGGFILAKYFTPTNF